MKDSRISVHGELQLYAVVCVQLSVLVDAVCVVRLPISRVPGGHSMAAVQVETRCRRIAEKWHALAQRRLAYVRELECSGRWKLFYTDDQYVRCLQEAERAALLWGNLANQQFRRNSGLTPATPVPSLPV